MIHIPEKLTIASVSAELAPFSKTGGLGEVTRALPRALRDRGHHVIPIVPLHKHTKLHYPDIERIGEDNVKLFDGLSHKATFYQSEYDRIPVYFIDSPQYFSERKRIYEKRHENERFYFFNRAVMSLLRFLEVTPDVVQSHDWHAGLLPYFLHTSKKTFWNTAAVFTIHNLVFQMGHDWWTLPPEEQDDGYRTPEQMYEMGNVERINFALRGIRHADAISTVSEQHAKEILTKQFGEQLHGELRKRRGDLFGIVNGVNYDTYNPATDPGLRQKYTMRDPLPGKAANKKALQQMCKLPKRDDVPLVGMVSRITEQKGFDLLLEMMDTIMRLKMQIVILGSGQEEYEREFRRLRRKYPDRFSYLAWDPKIETQVYAGSDLFLMPSRFEPCGLGQLISLRYGSIPVVHAVGGLSDTINDYNPRTGRGNGFVFNKYDAKLMLATLTRAAENWMRGGAAWERLVRKSMRKVYSWDIPAQRYISLFRHAIWQHYESRSGKSK